MAIEAWRFCAQKRNITDEYGGETDYTYDINGRVIRTVNPDDTETRMVYDELGRAVWTTQRFVPANGTLTSTANVALATHTVYNQLGQVVQVEQYKNIAILITSATVGSATIYSSNAASSTVTTGNLLSTSFNWYDEQGRVIQTKDAAGLRTGMVYHPDGSVLYSGPLSDSTPDGGSADTTDGVTTYSFVLEDFDTAVTQEYGIWDSSKGLFYDQMTDANDNVTKSYSDSQGRNVLTVYDDGSFTQTVYGVTGHFIGDNEGDSLRDSIETAMPDELATLLDDGLDGWFNNGEEVVTINQRKSSDPMVLTYRLYDEAGNLRDVWLPPVVDGATTSTTPVRPHWSYVYDGAGDETMQINPSQQTAFQDWITLDPEDEEDEAHSPTSFTGTATKYQYDQYGDQIRETLPDSSSHYQSWAYNSLGQLTTHTDFKGSTATYTYVTSGVHAGMLDHVVYAGTGLATQTVTYTYDNLNRRDSTSIVIGGGSAQTYTYAYDAVTRQMSSVTSPQGKMNYVYDPATQNLTETWTGTSHGSATTDVLYGHDAQGRLSTVTTTRLNGSALGTALVTTYIYDPAGSKNNELLPNGDILTYVYDGLNRLIHVLEKQVNTTLFSQSFVLNSDGTRASVHEVQGSDTRDATWTYDNDGRLTGESIDSSVSGDDYSNSFTYDLRNNRMKQVHTGPGGGSSATTVYSYNANDEMTASGADANSDGIPDTLTASNSTYDLNGSLISQTPQGGTATTYAYDARNKLIGESIGGSAQASFVYDDDGNRVSETAGSTTTNYLTDTNNPTGYDQPIEARVSGSPTMSYILSDRVLAQANSSGTVSYLMPDGHGSTRALTSSSGAVTSTLNYDSFGGALNYTASSPPTVFLFGGDAVYDPITGLYLHGDGVRDRIGFQFIQRDTYQGTGLAPLSLHRRLYGDADPISNNDPTGHFSVDSLVDAAKGVAVNITFAIVGALFGPIEWGIDMLEGVQGGFANAVATSSGTSKIGAFGVGFVASFAQTELRFLGMPCWLASGIGGSMVEFGNDLLARGSDAFSWSGLGQAAIAGVISAIFPTSCFVTGTEVLTGDDSAHQGKFTETKIEDIHVGDLVLTRDQYDPNAPLEQKKVVALYRHTVYQLEDVTFTNSSGKKETIQTTPEHPFYVEGIGWVGSSHLLKGEHLISPDGSEVTVASVAAEDHPEGVTVYNFQVEDDHTYFVSPGGTANAAVWVHNDCADARELRDNLVRDGQQAAKYAAHVVPVGDFSKRTGIVQRAIQGSQEIIEEVGVGLNDAENGFFTKSARHLGTHTDDYFKTMFKWLKEAKKDFAGVAEVLANLVGAAQDGMF